MNNLLHDTVQPGQTPTYTTGFSRPMFITLTIVPILIAFILFIGYWWLYNHLSAFEEISRARQDARACTQLWQMEKWEVENKLTPEDRIFIRNLWHDADYDRVATTKCEKYRVKTLTGQLKPAVVESPTP
jgi:heme/copper-type cytochrome/quinol oxidase subunit 2